MASMPASDYFCKPTNLAFHDLTSEYKPPPNLRSLLGLGLKFIPTPFRTTTFEKIMTPGKGIPSLERSMKLRYFFLKHGTPPIDLEYHPKLHVPSDFDPQDGSFPKILPGRILSFKIRIKRLFKRKKSIPNLSKHHRHTLQYLRKQNDFIIANCDKNLGPAVIERDKYIRLAFRDHLSDSTTYERLSKNDAISFANESRYRIEKWIEQYEVEIGKHATKYLTYHLNQVTDMLPYFYLLMKVHKPKLATHPIVSCSGSLFEALGVWIDTHLQQVAKSSPTYIDSSFKLLEKLKMKLFHLVSKFLLQMLDPCIQI